MKNRIVVFYGYVGFIGVLVGIPGIIYALIDSDLDNESILLPLFGLLCILFYLIHTSVKLIVN